MNAESITQAVLFPQFFSRQTVVANLDQEHGSPTRTTSGRVRI